MLTALALSIGQLGDRRILRVLAKSIAVTLILFALFGVGVWWGTRAALDMWAGGSSDALAAAVAVVTTALALWLAFRAVGIAVIGVFADEVVGAVEAQHYPAALASAREVGFAGSTMMGLRSAVRVVAVNAALLPVYIVLLATGVGTAAAFFIACGPDQGKALDLAVLQGGAGFRHHGAVFSDKYKVLVAAFARPFQRQIALGRALRQWRNDLCRNDCGKGERGC